MTNDELWSHVQEPYYRLQCGFYVYVSDWQTLTEIQGTGAGLRVMADGQLGVDRPERLTEWQSRWLLERESTVCAVLDDDSKRSTPQ